MKVSHADSFRLGFRFAETKRWNKKIRTSKVKPFTAHFTEKDVILDAGCGVGIELEVVSNIASYSVGLDIDAANLSTAMHFLNNKKNKIDFIRADIRFLPFKTSCFSKILCFDVLEHLAHPEGIVNSIRRILRSAGECFIRVPNRWTLDEVLLMLISKMRYSEDIWNVRHVSFFDSRGTAKLFSNADFSFLEGYTTGSLKSNLATGLYTVASIITNILFYDDYYRNRYYFFCAL